MTHLEQRIRQVIREHVSGPCPPPGQLGRLYRDQLIDQVPFDHVLCCQTCLEVVNEILGLPRLAERRPLDASIRQPAANGSDSPSDQEDKNGGEPPLDDGSEGPPPDDSAQEEEERVEKPAMSFQRVRQAMAQAYEAQPEQLIICINGRPCASQAVERAPQTMTLWPSEDIEFIEVIGDAGVRLAYMEVDPLTLEAGPQHGRVALSGDREIGLQVSVDQAGQSIVQVTYRDPAAEAAAVEAAEKTRWSWLAPLIGWRVGMRGWKGPALAMVSAILLLGGVSVLISSYLRARREMVSIRQERDQMRQQVAQLTEELEKVRQALAPAPPEAIVPGPRGKRAEPSPPPAKQPVEIADNLTEPAAPPGGATGPETTRGRRPGSAAESLLAVRRVYVMSLGKSPFSRQVREKLIQAVQASGRFSVTNDPDEAEAALKGSAIQEETRGRPGSGGEIGIGRVRLQLVSANGRVLWTTAGKGSAADLADRLVGKLVEEVQSLKHRRQGSRNEQ